MKTPSYLEILAMFQNRATNGNNPDKNKIEKKKYIVNKSKALEKFEAAKKDQAEKTMQRRKTVAFLPNQLKSDNVRKMSVLISEKDKVRKENEEKIKKEIHEKKVVDNSAIRLKTQRMEEERKKVEEEKIKEISKNYEANITNYDINEKLNNINSYKYTSNVNYDTEKAVENIKKNEKLKIQIDNNLNKIFGDEINKKNLSFEEKYHLFDRKINNYEDNEKLKLNITIKNPNSEYEYESKIYDNDKKLITQSEKQKGEKEIILYNNLVVDYNFTKRTSYIYEIIKSIQNLKEMKTEMNIPLNNIISTEDNTNYEKKIENFEDNEIINIGFDSNENDNCDNTEKEKEKEKIIQIFFKTNNQAEYSNDIISYSIQKDNKIIYKSPLCNSSHIKQTDKIPINLLTPEFEISFYNKNYDEQKIPISIDELLNQKTKSIIIDLPEIQKLDVVICAETFDKISLIQLKKDGLNIDLSIAIDFTASNGTPTEKDSLHYVEDGFINNYEKAIRACCDIISVYNKKNEYNVYGFGADVNEVFSNCFNINSEGDSKIKGIDNIIKEYKKTVKSVEFSGGTYFAPVINKINDNLKNNSDNLNYNVLLIISDGQVHDISEIIDSVVKSSKLPMSIIIIGVGSDVNDDMKRLNGEKGKLMNSHGEYLEKDIIQYVHFNDYNENIEKLTQEVFRYIPQQIKDYFQNQKK